MKNLIIITLITAAFILIPAILIGLGFYLYCGKFLFPFLTSVGVIFVLGEISNILATKHTSLELQRMKINLVERAAQQHVEVSCAYCKERNQAPVILNNRNTFECLKCKQTNLIIFQFAAAQITTPLENPQLGTILLPPEKTTKS